MFTPALSATQRVRKMIWGRGGLETSCNMGKYQRVQVALVSNREKVYEKKVHLLKRVAEQV